MKKFLFLSLILGILATTANAANINPSPNPNRASYRTMNESQRRYNEVCQNVADNFHFDHRFANYLRAKCMLFESDRQRAIATIFPSPNNVNDRQYRNQYDSMMADFVVAMNNKELEIYKMMVVEYCKYNAYRYAKKDPQACSPARINSLF